MKNFKKSLATAIACGVLLIGCTATLVEASSEQNKQVKIIDGLYRIVDCSAGVVIYQSSHGGLTTVKLDNTKLISLGCNL